MYTLHFSCSSSGLLVFTHLGSIYFHSASIDNRLNLLYIHLLFIHITALLIDLQSLHMSALCHVTPSLYYNALISLYLSLKFLCLLSPSLFLSHFKMCLLEQLYHKDCTTIRQSWLFSFYVVVNNKQDEMKLENIYSKLQSYFVPLQFVCLSILHHTTFLFALKYFP